MKTEIRKYYDGIATEGGGFIDWKSNYYSVRKELDELKAASSAPVGGGMRTGVDLIKDERKRQIEIEKWDYEHDEDYKNGEMMGAAGCYIANALSKYLEQVAHTNQSPLSKFQIYDFGESDFLVNSGDRGDRRVRKAGWVDAWPWDNKYDKRKKHDIHRSLVIAGALIAAELDRINGAKPSASPIPVEQEPTHQQPVSAEEIEKMALHNFPVELDGLGEDFNEYGRECWISGAKAMLHNQPLQPIKGSVLEVTNAAEIFWMENCILIDGENSGYHISKIDFLNFIKTLPLYAGYGKEEVVKLESELIDAHGNLLMGNIADADKNISKALSILSTTPSNVPPVSSDSEDVKERLQTMLRKSLFNGG